MLDNRLHRRFSEDNARVLAIEERVLKREKEAVDELIQVLSSDDSSTPDRMQYIHLDVA